MNLGARAVLIAAVTSTLGFAAIFGVASTVLLQDYQDAETSEVEAEMARIQGIVERDLVELESRAIGVAEISKALFGGNGTIGNDTAQILFSVFVSNQIDALFAINQTDGSLFGFAFDRANLSVGPVDARLNASFAHVQWQLETGADSSLLAGDNGTFLVATTTLAFEDTPFVMAIAQLAEGAYVDRLQEVAQAPVDIQGPTAGLTIDRLSGEQLVATIGLASKGGEPVASLQLQMPRDTYQQGLDTLVLIATIGSGVILLGIVAVSVLMRATVTGRVNRLAREMKDMAEARDFSARIKERGDDEVTRMATSFNKLMASVERREKELQQTNQDLDNFARTVSHDLKSPLSTFSLNLRNLRLLGEVSDGQEKSLVRMDRGVALMAQRIDSMLAYSRSRTAQLDVRAVAVDKVLVAVQESLAAELDDSGAELNLGPLPTVLADGSLLAQVFQNLIGNAIKYCKPDEWPRIWVYEKQGAIVVEDRGRGFNQEDAGKMLAPFTRLDNVQGVEGSGIGLATVARIIERLGGRLEAQGRPNIGARFLIWLPQA